LEGNAPEIGPQDTQQGQRKEGRQGNVYNAEFSPLEKARHQDAERQQDQRE
jgi:hypothetical protein